jgi:hypothetical protein
VHIQPGLVRALAHHALRVAQPARGRLVAPAWAAAWAGPAPAARPARPRAGAASARRRPVCSTTPAWPTAQPSCGVAKDTAVSVTLTGTLAWRHWRPGRRRAGSHRARPPPPGGRRRG